MVLATKCLLTRSITSSSRSRRYVSVEVMWTCPKTDWTSVSERLGSRAMRMAAVCRKSWRVQLAPSIVFILRMMPRAAS